MGPESSMKSLRMINRDSKMKLQNVAESARNHDSPSRKTDIFNMDDSKY